jgi:hypothetical protein
VRFLIDNARNEKYTEKQGRQITRNVTLKRVRETIIAVENK